MKREVFVLLSFILVIGMVGFVVGDMVKDSNGAYDVEIYVEEGWNLVAGIFPQEGLKSDSEIGLKDIGVVWYYSPVFKKYYQLHPNNEIDNLPVEIGRQLDEDVILTSAMWIYSEKSGLLKYSTLEDYPELENRELISGWNFVTITPDMTADLGIEGQYLYSMEVVKGTCDIEKIYAWETSGPDARSWVELNLLYEYFESFDGYGIVIKVSDNCKLGRSGSGVSPPGLPGGNGITGDYDVDKDILGHIFSNFCIGK